MLGKTILQFNEKDIKEIVTEYVKSKGYDVTGVDIELTKEYKEYIVPGLLPDTIFKSINVSCIKADINTEKSKANWLIWGGWSGNHDQRIEDAKCSNCGYTHPTVFGSTDKLSKFCLSCKSEMGVCES